jgi:microcystin-dependent protein
MKELHAKGWVECAGQSFSRTAFTQLYKAIGNAWGSADGTNVFYLPDLRGQILRVWNHAGSQAQQPAFGGDPDANQRSEPRPEIPAPGTKGTNGDAVASIQKSEVGAHTHQVKGYANAHLLLGSLGNGVDFLANVSPFFHNTDLPNEPHAETRPNNVYVMYMMYVGVPVSADVNELKLLKRRVATK